MDDTRELERQLIEKAQAQLQQKIAEGKLNGDPLETMLIVLFSINRRVGHICDNPLVVLGEYFQKYPKVTVPVLLVSWTLLGASVAMALVAFARATGISVHLP